jgi:hypothetical protein
MRCKVCGEPVVPDGVLCNWHTRKLNIDMHVKMWQVGHSPANVIRELEAWLEREKLDHEEDVRGRGDGRAE